MALVCLVAPAVHAAPPEAMTYQGYLVDANGNPLATNNPANYPVIFRIFAAATGGASLWSEQQIVTVDKGNFSVILSEGTSIGIGEPKPLLSAVMGTNGADRYIELSVTVPGSPQPIPILPRMRLLPSPYAFLSTSANQLVNPNGAAVVTYANSRVEVAGNLFTSGTISGNGSGLTGLTAGQLPNIDASKITSGTLSDARLSANVALLADNNAFVGNQTISGTLGLVGNTLGEKISLWGQSGNTMGFGVQSALLQIHTDGPGTDIAFGYGSSAAMTEVMRIKGNGDVGIGTTSPTENVQIGELTTQASAYLAIKTAGGNARQAGIKLRHFNDSIGFDIESDERLANNGLNILRVPNGPPTSAMFIDRFSGNVGVATTAPTAKLEVNGDVKIKGERPFAFKVFTLTGGATLNTGWPTNKYHVSIAGFASQAGDIYEGPPSTPNLITVRALQGYLGSPNWHIRADFRTHEGGQEEVWNVTAMRIMRELVTDDSTF